MYNIKEQRKKGRVSSTYVDVLCLKTFFFGSDRSSRNANVRSFVRSFVSNLSRAVNLHLSGLESDQRALEHSGGNQSHTVGA